MRHHFVSVFVWLVCLAVSVAAQIQSGTLNGAVTDASGARVANATVQLSNTLASYRAVLTTDDTGAFTFSNLPFAAYDLRIEAAGFAPLNSRHTLRANVPLSLQLTLNVTTMTASTNVKAVTSLIETDNASTTNALSPEISFLPGS